MLYCKECQCIIVPGRAFLAAGGYYCPHCMEQMNRGVDEPTMKVEEERGRFYGSL